MSDSAAPFLVLALGAAAMLYMTGASANTQTDSTGMSGLLDSLNTATGDVFGMNTNQGMTAGDPQSNLQAFLDMISISEGTFGIGDNGYNVVVGGSLFDNGYVDHPRIVVQTRYGKSDAAGRYQIMAAVPGQITTNTWDWISAGQGLTDFSPQSQDACAIYILKWKNAYQDVLNGNIQSAISKVASQWASLPGSPYGQSPHDLSTVLGWYQQQGGAVA